MSWRTVLHEYLTAHKDETIRFGDLVKEIAPHMPRYAAERQWHRQHGDNDEIVAPVRKFARLLLGDLCKFDTEIIGRDHVKGKRWQHDTLFRMITRPCEVCGERFVVLGKTLTCSRKCATTLRWRRWSVSHDVETEVQDMAPHPRHPEIAALEAIVEALQRLPDQAARARVLVHAKQIVEAEDPSASPLRVVEPAADEAAD